jgi:hypothetical protein
VRHRVRGDTPPEAGRTTAAAVLAACLLATVVAGCGTGEASRAGDTEREAAAVGVSTTVPSTTVAEPVGKPVLMVDSVPYPFDALVKDADVVVTGRIVGVDPVTKWSTSNGKLEPDYSSADRSVHPLREWQEVTVAVDRVLVDTRSVVSDEPLLVRYEVAIPTYEAIDPALEGASVFVCAQFFEISFPDGSKRELLYVVDQATYIEAEPGVMVRLYSVIEAQHYAEMAADPALRRSDADAVSMDELVDRVEHPRPRSEWIGDHDFDLLDVEPVTDPDAELIVP